MEGDGDGVGDVVRVPNIHNRTLTLSGFSQLLASIHPVVHRQIEPGYTEGFAEDVVHDGLVFARAGAISIVDSSYVCRLRPGSACNSEDPLAAEKLIRQAYEQRIRQILHHPTQISATWLANEDREELARLFRFRAAVSGLFAVEGAGMNYHAFVAGREAELWDNFWRQEWSGSDLYMPVLSPTVTG